MSTYDYARKCSGGPQPGTSALLRTILDRYPKSRSMGIYNCRSIVGGKGLSLHAEGRAVDVAPASAAQGTQIAAWLLANVERFGLQEIIWNRKIWSALHPSSGWRGYSGSNPHTDHLHIGQNWNGARAGAAGGNSVDGRTISSNNNAAWGLGLGVIMTIAFIWYNHTT